MAIHLSRIQNQLRAPKQGDRLSSFIFYFRIPHLRRPAAVDAGPGAVNDALARRTQKVTFQFDGREILRAFGQICERAVAAGRVCQGDHRRGVQVSIRREQLRANDESAGQASRLHGQEFDAKQARQIALAAGVELVNGGHSDKV